jgi:hypothetical protein
LLTEWLRTTEGRDWQATFARWQIGTAVIERDSALARLLRAESAWREVYSDEMAAVFIRQ